MQLFRKIIFPWYQVFFS